MPEGTAFPIPLPVAMAAVIAVSALAAIAITAWVLHQIARRALDKTTPDGVESVILALSALVEPFRMFLPWSQRGRSGLPKDDTSPPSTEDPK